MTEQLNNNHPSRSFPAERQAISGDWALRFAELIPDRLQCSVTQFPHLPKDWNDGEGRHPEADGGGRGNGFGQPSDPRLAPSPSFPSWAACLTLSRPSSPKSQVSPTL